MKRLFILVTVALAASNLRAADSTNTKGQDLPHLIRDSLDAIRIRHQIPGMAGAIVTSKGLLAMNVCGTRKAGTETPVREYDHWHLGSDTKAMTAMIIASLVERELLSWDATIGSVFQDIASSLPVVVKNITLDELLSHRAGLPENADWNALSEHGTLVDQRFNTVQQLSSITLLAKPETEFHYSNLGYVIAAAMAERVTGMSWEELMQQKLFTSLSMNSAGFGGMGTPGKIDQPWGHTEDGKPVATNGPKSDNPEVMGPAGTVHCSIADWSKFIADQLRGAEHGNSLFSADSYTKILTPLFGGDYGMGWSVTQRPWGGGTVYMHAGSNTMNFAIVWMAPQRDFAVLVCCNQGGSKAEAGCDEAAGALIKLFTQK